MDYSQFFSRNSKEVAQDLLGKMLVRKTERGITAGKILQTGAIHYIKLFLKED